MAKYNKRLKRKKGQGNGSPTKNQTLVKKNLTSSSVAPSEQDNETQQHVTLKQRWQNFKKEIKDKFTNFHIWLDYVGWGGLKQISNLYRIACLLLLISVYYVFHDTITGIRNHMSGDALTAYKVSHEILNQVFSSVSFSFFFIALVCLVSYEIIKTRRKDNYCSHMQIVLFAMCIFLWLDNKILFQVKLFGALSVGVFVLAFLVACMIPDVVRFVKNLQQGITNYKVSIDSTINKYGFTTDDIANEDKLDDNRKEYANTLLGRLKQTKVNKEAFAVAIMGKWGAGKSSFMTYMNYKLSEANYACVVYDPWTNDRSSQITEDFMQILRRTITTEDTSFNEILTEYAEALRQIKPEHKFVGRVFATFMRIWNKTYNVDDLKKEISKKMSILSKPIFVFIDNVDRMDAEEIYEILKLIRDTACFQNLVYVVSIDKEYVCAQLKEKLHMDNSGLYLEKIFQVEVSLPAVDEIDVIESLQTEIERMSDNKESVVGMITKLPDKEKHILRSILKTYRGTQHFSRQFVMTHTLMNKVVGRKNYELHDLLFMELLRYSDNACYEKIAIDPDSILQLSQGIESPKHYLLEKSNTLNHHSEEILQILFNDNMASKMHIALRPNYARYFCFGVSKSLLKVEEFDSYKIASIEEKEEMMKRWIKEEPVRKSATHIHDYIQGIFKDKISGLKEAKNAIDCFISWLKYEDSLIVSSLLPIICDKDKYNQRHVLEIRNHLHQRLLSVANEIDNHLLFARTISQNANSLVEFLSETTLDYNIIYEILLTNYHTYIANNVEIDPADLLFPSKEIYQLVKNSTISHKQFKDGDSNNPIINQLVDDLIQNEKKSKFKKRSDAEDMLSVSPTGYKYRYIDKENHTRQEVFDDDIILIQRFIEGCFDL